MEIPINCPCVVLLKGGEYAIARLLPASIIFPKRQLNSPEPDNPTWRGHIWFVEHPLTGGLLHLNSEMKRWEVTEVVKILRPCDAEDSR
jgi:hypothetical protein